MFCLKGMQGLVVSEKHRRDSLGPAARDHHQDTLGFATMEGCHQIMQGLVASDDEQSYAGSFRR